MAGQTKVKGESLPADNDDSSLNSSGHGMYAPDDLVGKHLANSRYELTSLCGEGSMAFVYKAFDNSLETDVIVKIPKPEKISDPAFRRRFGQERKLLVRLSHPHVVRILDMGEHESLPFVVMQFLPGGDLKERLTDLQSKGGQMSPASMKGWLREICGALDFVAEQGMIHRDVKPANILFDEHNNAFLSDFGLTKIVLGDHRDDESEMTGAGFVVGTPNYVAPEIILGNEYDGRADQYSLGILIYHLMSGEPPMQGASSSATMVNQTQRQLPLLSDVRPDFPRKAAIAVHKAIQKQPGDRFSTSLEFANAVIDGLAAARRRPKASAASTVSNASIASSQNALPPRQKRRRKKQGSSSQQLSDSSLLSQGESVPQKISKGKKGLVNCPNCDVPLPLRPMHAGRTGHCIHCHARLKIGKDLARLWLLSSSGGSRRKASDNRDLMIGEEVFGLTVPKKIALALAALLLMLTIGATIYMTMFFTGETDADRLKEKVNTNKSIEDG